MTFMLAGPVRMLDNQHQNEDELTEMIGFPYGDCINLCHTIKKRINELRNFIKEISEEEKGLGPEDALSYRKEQRPKLKEKISILTDDIGLLDTWNFDCMKNLEKAFEAGAIFSRVMNDLDQEHALFSENRNYFHRIISDAELGIHPPLRGVDERLRNISSDIDNNLSSLNYR